MRRLGLVPLGVLFLLLLLPPPAWAVQDVVNTTHNMSATGPGTVKSLTVSEVCVFCHTPHNASPSAPLWNHALPGQWYIEYGSTTLQARPGQPTGKSLLCLGCHDGTVALGALGNPPGGQTVDLSSVYLTGRARVGTDLADDHPISFTYDAALLTKNPQLVNPAIVDLPLEDSQVQCTTCHDAHEKDILPFLRTTTFNGALCATCHDKAGATWDWSASEHATSAATAGGADPWAERKPEWRGATVAENACMNCHQLHNAVTPQRLIKGNEESTCYLCHNNTVAGTDIQAETSKPYRHPVGSFSGVHDPAEDPLSAPKHVECEDCHNSHAVTASTAPAPLVPGAVLGVSGITAGGVPVAEADNLYEVCYKCHADNNVLSAPEVPRQINEANTRLEFDISNPSFHPVEDIGVNRNVPSLLWPLTTNSIIGCTDCHANNDGPEAGGSGPGGPHGSIYRPLLVRNYTTADYTPESPVAYELCYSCHDRGSILGDQSFKKHKKHIVNERTPCSACHDAHGISSTVGNPVNNSNLINFDPTIVFAGMHGEGPIFEDLGTFRGQCSLRCHNKNHMNKRY